MLPETFCAHFSHGSNDSHLNLPHTRNSSFGVSVVAMETTLPLTRLIMTFGLLETERGYSITDRMRLKNVVLYVCSIFETVFFC